MPVSRWKLLPQLQQLDGDNANEVEEEPPVQQITHTPVREKFPEEELEWAENSLDCCVPNVSANHHVVIDLIAHARI